MRRVTALCIVTLIVAAPQSRAVPGVRPSSLTVSSSSGRARSEIELLIDRLVEVDTQAFGTSRISGDIQFIATDKRLVSENGEISQLPEAHPIMCKLAQLGLQALPNLIDHLSDARETRLVIGRDLAPNECRFGGTWFANEYDPRFPEPAKGPSGVNSPHSFGNDEIPGKYVAKVGDLCYFLVGQIVDRELKCDRGQPTNCEVINSPIHSPELIVAVRHDWSGLTPKEHERGLENDSYSSDFCRAPDGLKRLLFYYPAAGKRVGLDLLSRPIFDSLSLGPLLENLWKSPDERTWSRLLKRANRELGPDKFAMIAWCLERNLEDERFVSNPEVSSDPQARLAVAVAKLFARFFPTYATSRNPRFPLVDIDDLLWTVTVLASSNDPDVVAAVARARKQIERFGHVASP